MPLNAGSPNANQPGTEVPTSAENAGRSARPLGRGLEEISHLFLPHPAAPSTHELTCAQVSARVPVLPETRAGVAVLRPGAPLTKDQLTATLRECQSALGDNMRAIGAGVASSPDGEIDLLALDRADQLTIIDVETTLDDGLLLRGISHVDWVMRNLANVKRMYPGWMIDASRPPRLFLVAPRFSLLLKSALRQITQPDITCFRYHEVELWGRTGILVEHLRGEGD
jgi:hypothetical protein